MHTPSIKTVASRRTFIHLRALAPIVLCAATFVAFGADALSAPGAFDIPGVTEVLSVEATGVQIYECHMDDSGHLIWKFREPLAILTANGKTIGRHYAGPSWQLNDGSTVVGKVVAQKPGAGEKDVALLQLEVVSHAGEGSLARATAVERLDTHGGVFAGECQQMGALHAEPYSASYVFLGN